MGTPHDSLFRDTFVEPEHAAPLLRAILPAPLVAAIDWGQLRPAPVPQVDEQQNAQQTDVLFTTRLHGRPALLYVLCEHKSRPDRWTALQVLAYVVGMWKDLRRRRPRPRALPPIVPVVVSFGRRRWRASTDLASLLDLRGMPSEQRDLVLAVSPQFAFTPHDFADKTAAEVRSMGLSLLGLWTIAAQQFVAPVGHDDDAAVAAIVEWADVAQRVITAPTGQHARDALTSYILKVTKLGARRLRLVFDQHIGAPAMKKFESTYDRITRESEAKGELTGAAKMLLRQLHRRFGTVPKATAARIARATAVELDRWADRVLDAKSLAEVFAD